MRFKSLLIKLVVEPKSSDNTDLTDKFAASGKKNPR